MLMSSLSHVRACAAAVWSSLWDYFLWSDTLWTGSSSFFFVLFLHDSSDLSTSETKQFVSSAVTSAEDSDWLCLFWAVTSEAAGVWLVSSYRSWASRRSGWSNTARCLAGSWCHRSSQSWWPRPYDHNDRTDQSWRRSEVTSGQLINTMWSANSPTGHFEGFTKTSFQTM